MLVFKRGTNMSGANLILIQIGATGSAVFQENGRLIMRGLAFTKSVISPGTLCRVT